MTTKEKSRQYQIWFGLILIAIVVISVVVLVWFDKNVDKASGIMGTLFVSLSGLIGANYFSKPGEK